VVTGFEEGGGEGRIFFEKKKALTLLTGSKGGGVRGGCHKRRREKGEITSPLCKKVALWGWGGGGGHVVVRKEKKLPLVKRGFWEVRSSCPPKKGGGSCPRGVGCHEGNTSNQKPFSVGRIWGNI